MAPPNGVTVRSFWAVRVSYRATESYRESYTDVACLYRASYRVNYRATELPSYRATELQSYRARYRQR